MNTFETNESHVDVHTAEVERALALVASVWEKDSALTVDEMCDHLNSIGDIVDGTSDFEHFVTSTNLIGRERLN